MSATHPRGAGHNLVVPLAVRQVLIEGLAELAGDEARISELFGRVDDLLQGSQDDYVRELREQLTARVRAGQGKAGIRVRVGYPPADAAVLPWLSIITDTGSENTAGAVAGDLEREGWEGTGTPDALAPNDYQLVEHSVLGLDWTTNLQVGCWATAGEEAEMLRAVALNILQVGSGRLHRAGAREVTYSESGFQPAEQYQPRTMYVPVIRATVSWTLRTTRRQRVPHWWQLRTGSFGNEAL